MHRSDAGVFSTFTWKAHKDCQDKNIKVLVSGYINGILLYTIEFDYNDPIFVAFIEKQLKKQLANGDVPGRNKTITFNYKSYSDNKSLKLYYLCRDETNLKILNWCSNKNFFEFLMRLKMNNRIV